MKLCIVGDSNDLIHSDTHHFVCCDKLDLEINEKESSLRDVDAVLIQADCKDLDANLDHILTKLNGFFSSNKKKIPVIITFKLTNFNVVEDIYTRHVNDFLNIVFITSIKENHKQQNRDKWIVEIHDSCLDQDTEPKKDAKKSKNTKPNKTTKQDKQEKENKQNKPSVVLSQSIPISEKTKDTVENLLHLLHYELEIDHKHTAFVTVNSINLLNRYAKDVIKVKMRYMKELKDDVMIDLTERANFSDLLDHMIIC